MYYTDEYYTDEYYTDEYYTDECPCDTCDRKDYCDTWEARYCCTLCSWRDECSDCENCDPMDI